MKALLDCYDKNGKRIKLERYYVYATTREKKQSDHVAAIPLPPKGNKHYCIYIPRAVVYELAKQLKKYERKPRKAAK